MKKNLLIGESGGSKTDWALISASGSVTKTTSESLHPKNWETFDWNRLSDVFAQMKIIPEETSLFFYGAGCNSPEKSEELHHLFSPFHFQNKEIKGDLTAAGLATLGNENGFVSILGSGSVCIHFENQAVRKFYGGFGRDKGDEGGGYFFGKMVLDDFFMKKLSSLQESILLSCCSQQEKNQLKNGEFSEALALQLPFQLSNHLFEFLSYHEQNFQLFFQLYVLPNVPENSIIHFVGSYAYFHEEIVKKVCHAEGYVPGKIIARPIDALVHYLKKQM